MALHPRRAARPGNREDGRLGLRHRGLGARLVLLPAVALFGACAVAWALLTGWTVQPYGWSRLVDAAGILTASAVAGLAAMACVLTLLGRRALSPWVVVGLLPAAWAAVAALGP